jgi:phosphate/sulfate permease
MEIKELEFPTEPHSFFVLGVLGSIVGAILGAGTWCLIAVLTNYEVGVIAWVLGGLAGLGMALGYRQARTAAGITAAVIAVLGIAGAKVMIFSYMERQGLSLARQQLATLDLPTEQSEQVFRLAGRDAARQTKREGLCPYEESFWRRLYEAAGRYAALPEDELAAMIVDYKEWRRSGRFADAEYVRESLPYFLLDDEYPEIWYLAKPLPPEEWGPIYQEALAQASAFGPDEQSGECRRRAYAMQVAMMECARRGMQQKLARGDRERFLSLLKEAYAEALAMEHGPLTEAFETAHAWEWEDEGEWNDLEWQRLRLTYLYAERAWREREGAPADEAPLPGSIWDECHQQAVARAADVPDAELVDRVREAQQKYDDEVLVERQRRRNEWQREVVGSAVAHIAGTFGLLDLLFVALAVVTAYRVAVSRTGRATTP